MNVLIIGSGGREHALAWKASQSPRLRRLFVAPGNAGTARIAQNVPIPAEDTASLISFARTQGTDLVIVGPEAPLAAGLADEMQAAGLRVFGPSRAAAQIEASKAFAKAFMARHHIPTARYGLFADFAAASAHLQTVDYPVVIKASGLAAGKGVIVPASPEEASAALHHMMVEREFGDAGAEVVIEERLEGEEVSLLAFTDGRTVKPMPPARDHKRLRDGDAGPNTGGMGAYAPVPFCLPERVEEWTHTILQPTVDGLREEERPFIGVLYAGLMLTSAGARVLEFNCRLGDPETQPLMLLLESDLLEIAEACTTGRLADTPVRWKEGAAACIVVASERYPDKPNTGHIILGLEKPPAQVQVFHAATRQVGEQVVTAGGRVLGVTAWGPKLSDAVQTAYDTVGRIQFPGMQYRHDIGRAPSAYASAGVNIDAGNRAVALMGAAVRSTYSPAVLAGIGAFGGMFDASALQAMRSPVLVASTDGVGTKVRLAAQARRYESVGQDIVNHCIDDILVQGARPLFFLDYLASSRLEPERVAEMVSGMAAACRAAHCVLLGGETAEMPGVYAPNAFDVAGTMVGVVERAAMLPRPDVCAGDLLVGLRSSGPHTNGYTLIRQVFGDVSLDAVLPELGMTLAEALLAPHRSYLPILQPALHHPSAPIKALAHITGGGLVENLPRVLPEGIGAVIRTGSWEVPPLFRLIQERGRVSHDEMYRVFNMGIGMVAVIAPEHVDLLRSLAGEETKIIGELAAGERKTTLI